jgi:stage V sporulation protein D (sporulation-specific penicillin-binding protein)
VTAARGTIYDANGKVLAMSASVETVYISPYELFRQMRIKSDCRRPVQNLGVDKDKILQKWRTRDPGIKRLRRKSRRKRRISPPL